MQCQHLTRIRLLGLTDDGEWGGGCEHLELLIHTKVKTNNYFENQIIKYSLTNRI